jgi:hypothetical protein
MLFTRVAAGSLEFTIASTPVSRFFVQSGACFSCDLSSAPEGDTGSLLLQTQRIYLALPARLPAEGASLYTYLSISKLVLLRHLGCRYADTVFSAACELLRNVDKCAQIERRQNIFAQERYISH